MLQHIIQSRAVWNVACKLEVDSEDITECRSVALIMFGCSSNIRAAISAGSLRRCRLARPTLCSFLATKATDDDSSLQQKTPASGSIVPGIALSALTASGGFAIASSLSSIVPVSGIPVSILLGMGVKNTVGYDSSTFSPGITFATKTILQTGIVCVAAKLSFLQLVESGAASIPVVLASVGTGMVTIPLLSRAAGLDSKLGSLLTAGTSICGVTAITALAPAIQASPRDIAVAVANTVAFGTIGMLLYPYLLNGMIAAHSEQVGLVLGVAIHDTSQVLGAALSYKETFGDDVAFSTAAVTKLIRNLGLAVAIPFLTFREVQHGSSSLPETDVSKSPATMSGLATFTKYVPPFLIAFIAMSGMRSIGDVVLSDIDGYTQAVSFVGNDMSKYALGTAMAGVGLCIDRKSLHGVGWRPFAVGLVGALAVGSAGFTTAMITM